MPQRDVFGRIPSPLDTRDYPMRATLDALGAGEEIRTRMWRAGSQELDQGPTPHCVGFSGANWLQNSPTRSRVGDVVGHILYGACKALDGYDGDGTWVRVLFQVLKDAGLVSRYSWATTPDDLKRWVCNVGPVVVGTEWYSGMSLLNVSGYARPTGSLLGGHAYLVRGYDNIGDSYRCINSWGEDWGQNGEFWISATDLNWLRFERDGEAVGMEQAR